MKSPMGIIALIVLVGAVGYIIYDQRSQAKPGEPVKTLKPLACTNCDTKYAAEVGAVPTECKSCGNQTAWRAFQCLDPKCRTIFPNIQSGDVTAAIKCTKCGGGRTTDQVDPTAVGLP